MEERLTYRGAVMTWECDSNRHMNVMYYINKFEHAGRSFDLELGLHQDSSESDHGVVVLEQQIKYHKEVFEDDLLYIKSSLKEIGNKAFKVYHEMYNGRNDELLSSMLATLVRFDKVHRKALPFPEERKAQLIERWGI
ncbi:MAG: acyl-CoA thioester hydrolase [Saprospiraceae bacterium]|jgi:acyl-CoA thioester hydrolase